LVVGLPDPCEKPTLSVDEVAKVLGWGRSAVYEGVRRGELPALRLGRRIRIPTAKLLELLGIVDERRVVQPATAEPPRRDDLVELLAEVVGRGIALAKERGDL
jgi:excisionase family DNA binding protein